MHMPSVDPRQGRKTMILSELQAHLNSYQPSVSVSSSWGAPGKCVRIWVGLFLLELTGENRVVSALPGSLVEGGGVRS